MYLSNYIVFHGEKQGVEHQQNTQFLRSYFASFNKSIGELRQMQKHFPQLMHKQNLLHQLKKMFLHLPELSNLGISRLSQVPS